MKINIHLVSILLALFVANSLRSQPKAYFDYRTFYAPKSGYYVETYLDIFGDRLEYRPGVTGVQQAKVLITMLLKKDGQIINASKKEVVSPPMDTLVNDFLDLQQLSAIPGNYSIDIEIKDLYADSLSTISFTDSLEVLDFGELVFISKPLFIGKTEKSITENQFTKSGFDVIPLVTSHLPGVIEKLQFYSEIYNSSAGRSDSADAFILFTEIRSNTTKEVFKDLRKVQRLQAAPVVPVLAGFDIRELPSGSYTLVVEMRDRSNQLIANVKQPFTRENKGLTLSADELEKRALALNFVANVSEIDTMFQYVDFLYPKANQTERRVINEQRVMLPTLRDKQQFFYQFWLRINPENPSFAWQDYLKEVRNVNKSFSTVLNPGYRTDRGRVYLQYGAPNVRQEVPTEPASYPYEIWQYYQINELTNRKFIFYNQSLATNDYDLLHSDMFGEPRNQNWQRTLSRRNNPMDNPDLTKPKSQFGNRAGDYYLNPR